MDFHFPTGELTTAAMLSAVTDRSVRVWLRDPRGAPQIASLRIDGRVAAEAQLLPAPDHDWIAVADLVLDRPAPHADFAVEVAGLTRQGRLAPARGERAPFSFAFGSCHLPFAAGSDGALVERPAAGIYPAMARALRARQARFLLLLGDQVYSDALAALDVPADLRQRAERDGHFPPLAEVVAAYRHLYRGYFNQPGFRALLEEWPTCFIWDDHDIFNGWGAEPPDALGRHLFAGAAQAYREYQHWRNPGADVDDPLPYAYAYWYGDVGLFVLDGRGERDSAAGVVLGEGQWRHLDAFLAEADQRDCPTVFVSSSVPVVHFSPALIALGQLIPGDHQSGVRDRWSSPAPRAERDRLLARLFAWQAGHPTRQAILLSGDVHAGAIVRVERDRDSGAVTPAAPASRSSAPTHAGRPPHPGGAIPTKRDPSAATVHQWTSSALTTPLSPFLFVANTLGTALVRLGEWRYQVTHQALVPRNNFGLIDVTPIPGGGHLVDLRLCTYHPARRTARVAARATARPERFAGNSAGGPDGSRHISGIIDPGRA